MNFDEFMSFIHDADNYLKNSYNVQDTEKMAYARLTKVSEEMGELSAEILKSFGRQSKAKLENFKKDDLENEFADVIITVVLLAKTMNVDINKSLENKIAEIRKKLGL